METNGLLMDSPTDLETPENESLECFLERNALLFDDYEEKLISSFVDPGIITLPRESD